MMKSYSKIQCGEKGGRMGKKGREKGGRLEWGAGRQEDNVVAKEVRDGDE